MSSGRRLLYLGNVRPTASGGGGGIVLYRHFTRLVNEGWEVTSFASAAPASSGGETPVWRELTVPPRRPWWPPQRPRHPLLAPLSMFTWCRALSRLAPGRHEVVCTVAWGGSCWLATEFARAVRAKLVVFVHDHWNETSDPVAAACYRHACRHANRIFAVSEEMRIRLNNEFGPKAELLYPIPAARRLPFVEWGAARSRPPLVVHVGALHDFHVGFLSRLAHILASEGGRLAIVCPSDNIHLARLIRLSPFIRHQPYFTRNDDALDWLLSEASALVVMYAQNADATGCVPTGFPSRFVELAQLGLPILLSAPAGNPVHAWATRRDWTGFAAPDDDAALAHFVQHLTGRTTWEQLTAQTRRAAQTDFDPDLIHRRFVEGITAPAPRI